MFIPDFVIGWAIFLIPFALVVVAVARQRKSGNANGQGELPSTLNANGLPMIGGVDVNGNAFGSINVHQTNVNGLPMVGGVDVCGNSFGTSGHAF